MNADFKKTIDDASRLAKELRVALTVIDASGASLKTTQANQQSLQAELDKLVESGSFEDDANAQKVSTLNARLQLIPARLKQLEAEDAKANSDLQPILTGSYQAFQHFAYLCRTHAEGQATDYLKAIINPDLGYKVDQHAKDIARDSALFWAANAISDVGSPLAQMASKRFESMADQAIEALNRIPAIVAQFIETAPKR